MKMSPCQFKKLLLIYDKRVGSKHVGEHFSFLSYFFFLLRSFFQFTSTKKNKIENLVNISQIPEIV